jgi:excisionase family DNA binding protein
MYTVTEAAKKLKLTRQGVLWLIANKRLKAKKYGNCWLVLSLIRK